MILKAGKYRFREVCFSAGICTIYRVYISREDHAGAYIGLLESGVWVEHLSLRPDDVRVQFLHGASCYPRTDHEKILGLLMGRKYDQ